MAAFSGRLNYASDCFFAPSLADLSPEGCDMPFQFLEMLFNAGKKGKCLEYLRL